MSVRGCLVCAATLRDVAAGIAGRVAAGVAAGVALCAPLGLGCAGGLDVGEPTLLQAFDPELTTHARSLVFVFAQNRRCDALIDLGPEELADAFAPENVPLQVLTDPSRGEHVFGRVTPGVPTAYLVLVSVRAVDAQRPSLRDFDGTVFAMGCRDLEARAGTRHDLPIQLFPVGLR